MEPGDMVEVRPLEEIRGTLDRNGMRHGLLFMHEMEVFCGLRFTVHKHVSIIKLESTGEVKRLKHPTVSLAGVFCTGEHHEGCDRACFHLWNEDWLRRVSDGGTPEGSPGPGDGS